MLAKFLCKQTVMRHPSVRGLRFYVPLHSVDISFSYRQAQIFPVDVIPSQTEDSTRDAREGSTIVPDVHRSTGGP